MEVCACLYVRAFVCERLCMLECVCVEVYGCVCVRVWNGTYA